MKTLKRVWSTISTVLVVIVVILAVLLVGARVAGFHAYTVLSGSMEPTYHVGSLIFVRSTETREIKPGTAITYLVSTGNTVTHRVTAVIPDENDPNVIRFRTKGDANEAEDGGLVHSSNVIGIPVFSVPVIGYAAYYIQHPPGTYVAIAVVLLIVVAAFLPDGEKKKEPLPDGEQKENLNEKGDT